MQAWGNRAFAPCSLRMANAVCTRGVDEARAQPFRIFCKDARMGVLAVKMWKYRILMRVAAHMGSNAPAQFLERRCKMKLDMVALAKTLLDGSVPYALMRYIFRTQGAELKRLDYNAAAKELQIDRRTIARTVNALAAKKLLVIQDGKLMIAEAFIREVG